MIHLSGDVGYEITLAGLIDQTNKGETKAVISTFGGSLSEGIAIRDYLKFSKKIESIGCLGTVASSGTIIIQGVADRWATKATRFLIHNPQGYAEGDATNIQKTVDELRLAENDLINSYVEISGKSFEEIQALMKEERFLTADEALSLNLITRIDKLENFMSEPKKDEKSLMKDFFNLFHKLTKLEGFKNLVVQTTDGTELDFGTDIVSIEQVSVGLTVAAPDGDYSLVDGTVITIAGNKVTAITPPAVIEDALKAENEALKAQIVELTAKVNEVTNKLSEATNKVAEFSNLKAEFETFKGRFSNHVPNMKNEPAIEPVNQNQPKRLTFKIS